METVQIFLTFVFAIVLFIWFKRTHIVFTTNWFWGNASIFGSCLIAGYIISLLVLTLLIKVVSGVLSIAVIVLVILFCLAALYGLLILIYGFVHRKEVHSSDKPQRSGLCGRLDHYTENLWESKWFAYCIYGIVLAGLIFVLSILGGDIVRDRQAAAAEQVSEHAASSTSQSNEAQTAADSTLLDLSTFSGTWTAGNDMTCTIIPNGYAEDRPAWSISIVKTDPNTAEQSILGPFAFEAVDPTHANATYHSDNFGHYGIIELVVSPNQKAPRLIVTAHDSADAVPNAFSFAADTQLSAIS